MTDLEQLIQKAGAKGKERKYLDWLRTQPSALSGQFSWNDGTPFCEPAHWRTARYAGTGQKPEYLAIPLTHLEHRQAHQHGDSTIGNRDWWEAQCVLHLRCWIDQ